ncbi:MAG: hypothetical protein ACTS6J_02120 [Burkholderiales bacterium]
MLTIDGIEYPNATVVVVTGTPAEQPDPNPDPEPVPTPEPKPVPIPPGVRVIENTGGLTFMGTSIWGPDRITAVRFKRTGRAKGGFFRLASFSGSTVYYPTTIALSKIPGDMRAAATQPRATSTQMPQFNFGELNGVVYYPIDDSGNYYLNVKVDAPLKDYGPQLNFGLQSMSTF